MESLLKSICKHQIVISFIIKQLESEGPVEKVLLPPVQEFITCAGWLTTKTNGISQTGTVYNPLWGFLHLAIYQRAALHCRAFVPGQSDPSACVAELPTPVTPNGLLISSSALNVTERVASLALCFFEYVHPYLESNSQCKTFSVLTMALINDHTISVVSSLWMSLEKQSALKCSGD